MKTRIGIVLLLASALTFAFYLKSNAQDRKDSAYGGNGTIVTPTGYVTDTFLIADETTLNYGKTEAVINTTNQSVFNDIFKSHGTLFKRFTVKWEKDGSKRYKHYQIYLANADAAIIFKWAKTNL